jgi:prepilin-type processing-associated H-X9-DG protein
LVFKQGQAAAPLMLNGSQASDKRTMRPSCSNPKAIASSKGIRSESPTQSHRAFSFIELLVLLGTVIILIALLLPAIQRPKTRAPRLVCTSNLRQLGLAFRVWANEHQDKFPMAVSITNSGSLEYIGTHEVYRHFQVMSNEVIHPKILLCSTDRERRRATNFVNFGNENLSYFVGVDADESRPNMILSGDRNITGGVSTNGHLYVFTASRTAGWSKALHNTQGNVGLADGSVQQVPATLLQKQVQNATNECRLAIP